MTNSTKPQVNNAVTCEWKDGAIILLPCSGGSNCGQIANQVAASLNVLGVGLLCSVASIAADINNAVKSAKKAKRLVAIDGCQLACVKKAIEKAGLKVTDWVCVTNEGISNNQDLLLEEADIELVTQRVKELLSKPLVR